MMQRGSQVLLYLIFPLAVPCAVYTTYVIVNLIYIHKLKLRHSHLQSNYPPSITHTSNHRLKHILLSTNNNICYLHPRNDNLCHPFINLSI